MKKTTALVVSNFRTDSVITPTQSYTLCKTNDGKYSNYLLGNTKIYLFEIYSDTAVMDPNSLSGSSIQVTNNTSVTSQSFKDLLQVFSSKGKSKELLYILVKEIDQKKISPPTTITDSCLLPKVKKISFKLHEKNFITFQVGVMATNYNLNDFSISSGNLVVTPDSTQKKSWKSNMFAVVEFHLPRDIDNFGPIWKGFYPSW